MTMDLEVKNARADSTEIEVPLFEAPGGASTARREARERIVRHVEYCRFPRVCADQRLRLGVSRDLSPSGLCLRTKLAEPIGALLRVMQRGVDGRLERAAIARVAWTTPVADGSHWMGLALVAGCDERPIRIRYLRRPPEPVGMAS